jgi:adenylate cyclase
MADERVQRRLAAILAADVVGYSRLMEADEAGTLAALKTRRRKILDPLVAQHRGRFIKVMGDGVLIEFASAVDAVECAAALQAGMVKANLGVDDGRHIILRVGINLGDVMVEGNDLYGDGVNIAARLETLAQPGGICISDTLQKQLAGKTGVTFEDVGERHLKNIVRPVRVWRWVDAPVEAVPREPPSLPDRPSIAVLPFDNLSGQPEETYFSDGITEDIITGLTRFRSLFVIARNSSFAFRGKPTDIAEIGRRLGVSYLLEGSVRRARDRVRITAQLVEAATGAHLWAERYDRSLDDIFTVQDDVAQMIVGALFGRIQEAGFERSARMPTASLTAYDCLLRGLAYFRVYAEGANQRAREMFERAVTLDPRYALAHSYLAMVLLAMHGWATAPAEILSGAFAKARHAVELDPQDSRCHRILGEICLYRREYEMAEQHIRRAFDLNPNDSDAVVQKGRLLAMRGRPEEALDCLETAVRLNPLHPPWYNAYFGITLYSLRRFAEAAQTLKRMPDLGFGAWGLARLAACYAEFEQNAEAHTAVAEVLRLQPDFSTAEYMRKSVLLECEADRELLREGLLKAGLPE